MSVETSQLSNPTSTLSDLNHTDGKITEWPFGSDEDLIEEENILETPDNFGIAETTTKLHKESSGSTSQYQTTETSFEKYISKTIIHTASTTQNLTTSTSAKHSPISTTSIKDSTNHILSSTQEQTTAKMTTVEDISKSSIQPTTSEPSSILSSTNTSRSALTIPSSTEASEQPTSETNEKTKQSSSSTFETSTASVSTGSVISSDHACSVEMMPTVMSGQYGTITSPGFDDGAGYPPLSTCEWHIKNEEDKVKNSLLF